MAGHNAPLVTFLQFADARQLMLRRFRGQLVQLAAAQVDPRVEGPTDSISWQLDESSVFVGRLVGPNRRELARTARPFPSLAKAQRTAHALIAAGDRLDVHVVQSGAGFVWFLSLYGAPALVGVQRLASEGAARASVALAQRQLADALVASSSKKLPVANTGPLSVDPVDAHRFPSSKSGNPRPKDGMPVSNHLDTGTRGYHNS